MVANISKKVVHKQLKKISEYKQVFLSPVGRHVLFDLMKAHHIMNTCFVANDPYMSALREGERNVVLRILTIMGQDEDNLQKLMEEAQNDG